MIGHTCRVLAVAAILAGYTVARPEDTYTTHTPDTTDTCTCSVRVDTAEGALCGKVRKADDDSPYASFRGVPYAEQPVGERRFLELEPLKPWSGCYDAAEEKAVCYQTDVLFGPLMDKTNVSEACIYANIHVPLDFLPACRQDPAGEPNLAPILVFIHGGGFAFGSGHTDVYGPEYLVSRKVIVITFNYRLNVFGFLSLNSSKVPGNAGLRDMITLLHWVQKNAKAFGGDPDNVTIGGQSAGAVAAHLLSLSNPAQGLFKRAILMSGTAISSFYSPSPFFAQHINSILFQILGIDPKDPDHIYKQLVQLPAEKLHQANDLLINQLGLTTFVPVVESTFHGLTPVLDDTPDNLLAQGRDKQIPLLVGYTNAECETFRARLEEYDFMAIANKTPAIIVPPKLLFTTPGTLLPEVMGKMLSYEKYYNGTISLDGFIKSCTDGFYEYPVLKLAEARENAPEEPVYVYRFTFDSDKSIIKENLHLKFSGVGHVEDMTYLFKANSVLKATYSSFPPRSEVDYMRQLMPEFIVNFMTCKPMDDESSWPAANVEPFAYKEIMRPKVYEVKRMSPRQEEITRFFDTLTVVE